jgi:RHS repeat-associated protein
VTEDRGAIRDLVRRCAGTTRAWPQENEHTRCQVTEESWNPTASATPSTLTFSYDVQGNMTGAADGATSLTFGYDEGHMISESATLASNITSKIDYQYQAGWVSQVAASTNNTLDSSIEYGWNAYGQLVTIEQSGTNVSPKSVKYTYNAKGQKTLLERFSDLDQQSPVAKTSIVMDSGGCAPTNNPSSISHSLPSGALLVNYVFGWDASGRLTNMSSSTDGSATFTYDSSDQLTGVDYANYPDLSFSFDATGNRTGGGNVPGADNRQQSDGVSDFAYDANGNLIRRTNKTTGAVVEYTYDARDRLTDVSFKPSATGTLQRKVHYVYDPLNRRVSRSVDADGNGTYDQVEYYVNKGLRKSRDNAGDDVMLRLDATGKVIGRYLHGASVDEILAEENIAADGKSDVLWSLADHQGSVRDMIRVGTSGHASIVKHVMYGPFGEKIADTDAAIANMYGYTGREFDKETGLQYNRARYYDPKLGRWISQDPIGFAAGDTNLYRYVGNSPTNATDPSGLQEKHVDPEYVAGREELQRIYRRYAELYGRNPDKYLWAGLATHAGSQVIQEIYDRLEREKLSALNMAVNGRLANPNSTLVLDMCEKARRQAALLESMQRIILQMAKDIEADIGKQFEAYDSEGLAGIDKLIQGGMPSDIRGPWEKIDSGDYAGGSEGLTRREQTTVLNRGYEQINGLLPLSAIGIPMSWQATSGLPNCPSFHETTKTGWFTDTRGPDRNARWIYIRDHVLRRWNSMTRQERDDWVKKQLGTVNSPPVQWP